MNPLEGRFTVVVPCFNEAERLDASAIDELVASKCRVILVDDGSTDDTRSMLVEMQRMSEAVSVLPLDRNRGKAEAVRRGMQAAVHGGAEFVGFLDADMSTPPLEMIRLATRLAGDEKLVGVIGSRVNMLGASIERSAFRHYFGRFFASIAAFAVGVPIYDTQCGAKVFRSTPEFRAAIDRPFQSPWAFDVELLVRLRRLGQLGAIREEPLRTWLSVDGSKLSLPAMIRTTVRLAGFAARNRWHDRSVPMMALPAERTPSSGPLSEPRSAVEAQTCDAEVETVVETSIDAQLRRWIGSGTGSGIDERIDKPVPLHAP